MLDIQAIIFNKSLWTQKRANNWLKIHKLKLLKNKKVRITENFLRYRITDPSLYQSFVTKKLQNGIDIIFGLK
jgi:hypothetical protein